MSVLEQIFDHLPLILKQKSEELIREIRQWISEEKKEEEESDNPESETRTFQKGPLSILLDSKKNKDPQWLKSPFRVSLSRLRITRQGSSLSGLGLVVKCLVIHPDFRHMGWGTAILSLLVRSCFSTSPLRYQYVLVQTVLNLSRIRWLTDAGFSPRLGTSDFVYFASNLPVSSSPSLLPSSLSLVLPHDKEDKEESQ